MPRGVYPRKGKKLKATNNGTKKGKPRNNAVTSLAYEVKELLARVEGLEQERISRNVDYTAITKLTTFVQERLKEMQVQVEALLGAALPSSAPEPRVRYVNVYRVDDSLYPAYGAWVDRKTADTHQGNNRVACIRVTEGQFDD